MAEITSNSSGTSFGDFRKQEPQNQTPAPWANVAPVAVGASLPQFLSNLMSGGGAGLGANILPAAANSLAAAYGTGRGLNEALEEWERGHGRQQGAITDVALSPSNPAYGLGGDVTKNDAVRTTMGLATPIALGLMALEKTGMNFFSGKDKDQVKRDDVRQRLKTIGMIDDQYRIQLRDGSYFDMGQDGGARLQNGLHAYQLDPNDPLVQRTSQLARIPAIVMTGGDPKLTADMQAYIANAAMSNAQTYTDVFNNVLHTMRKMGMTVEAVDKKLSEYFNSGVITKEDYDALAAANRSLATRSPQFSEAEAKQRMTPIDVGSTVFNEYKQSGKLPSYFNEMTPEQIKQAGMMEVYNRVRGGENAITG
jgi:hypothetical protein